MTFTRFLLTASTAISKGVPTMKGYRSAVAVCIAGLLGAVPPAMGQTSPPIALEISIKIGPLATHLNITKPVAQSVTTPAGASAVVFKSTLHLHAQNDTQTPTSSRPGRRRIPIRWSAASFPPQSASSRIFWPA